MSKKAREVREPLQVYLDGRDRALLDTLAKRENLPRAEILRLALRRLGAEIREGGPDGMSALMGALDGTAAPSDLAERHDEYLYAAPVKRRKRASR